ncbi:hypothetical protein LCGC14_1678540 [marine sediment metagenome]|uniref:Uncharacterized protein n=1 Tax=marine sediment metagenome TaxID=412755 RepID=A0A0F9KPA4_9ZZZZ
MDKQKLMKLIPYVILIVSVVFTLYAASILQNVENQCNTHLKEKYAQFVEESCNYCTRQSEMEGPGKIVIDLPGWAD